MRTHSDADHTELGNPGLSGKSLGADFLDNPIWHVNRVITVHSLGGCRMGNSAQEGVVDPSTPGAINLISGDDGGGYAVSPSTVSPSPSAAVPDAGTVSALNSQGLGTIYGDLDPAYDDCSDSSLGLTSCSHSQSWDGTVTMTRSA